MKLSHSAIQCFKSCRRMYELKYIYGMEPIATSDSIERGLTYHELLENLLNGDPRPIDSCENPKVRAMAVAFMRYIQPQIKKVEAVEDWFEFEINDNCSIIGRLDGRTTDGCVIEHKTTSGAIDGVYLQRLELDEQIPTYMIACGTTTIIYTVCQSPTIRQKRNETDEEFFQRCVDWYEEDTEKKIAVFYLSRSKSELQEFKQELDAISNEIANCKNFYRNPNHCMKWGRLCEYAPICKYYNPEEEYVQFRRRNRT